MSLVIEDRTCFSGFSSNNNTSGIMDGTDWQIEKPYRYSVFYFRKSVRSL